MIGDNIKRIRKRRGITLSELSQRSGISKSYLSNLERNIKSNPSVQVTQNIALVLQTEIDEIIKPAKVQVNENVWEEFVNQAAKEGLEEEILEDYKEVIAFIQWKREHLSGK